MFSTDTNTNRSGNSNVEEYQNGNDYPSPSSCNIDQTHKMGEVHIFNYQNYKLRMNLDYREGSEKDVEKLKQAFSAFNFNVHIAADKPYQDLSYKDTLKAINKAAESNVTHPGKYFVCCILTHGNSLDQVATYDQWLYVEDILEKCVKIIGKKQLIFIIQACRGGNHEQIVAVAQSAESTDSFISTKAYPNVLIARSSYPGCVSIKHKQRGSYFIQEICYVLEHLSSEEDLFQILTAVNSKMAYYFKCNLESNETGQMPIFYSTLTSKIFFEKSISQAEQKLTSLMNEKIKGWGKEPPELKDLKNSYYNISAKSVGFFHTLLQGQDLSALREGASILSRYIKNAYHPEDRDPWIVSEISEVFKNIKGKVTGKNCVIWLVTGPFTQGSLCDASGSKIYQTTVINNFIAKENFTDKEHGELVSMPKIFIFLMCASIVSSERKGTDESADGTDGDILYNVAEHANILQINILVKKKEYLKKTMDELVKQLKESRGSEDILTILTNVIETLVKRYFKNDGVNFFKNVVIDFNSTLTKKLVLP